MRRLSFRSRSRSRSTKSSVRPRARRASPADAAGSRVYFDGRRATLPSLTAGTMCRAGPARAHAGSGAQDRKADAQGPGRAGAGGAADPQEPHSCARVGGVDRGLAGPYPQAPVPHRKVTLLLAVWPGFPGGAPRAQGPSAAAWLRGAEPPQGCGAEVHRGACGGAEASCAAGAVADD